MKTRAACLAVFALATPQTPQYRDALPGYRYEFPRDHFNHPDFRTEWWYYTGNLYSFSGHRFGFELTFFRQAVERNATKPEVWDVRDLYLAHLALSDLDDAHFYHTERVNRAGPGLAGASEKEARIWNGNWQVRWQRADQTLEAVDAQFQLHLTLHSAKPPLIHGENGVSQKGAGPGDASHYISLTRLIVSGRIELSGQKLDVSGLAWMDHEFFTHQLQPDQVGWDWMSIQLDDNSELMLFRIRRRDGLADPYSAGTFVDSRGINKHLRNSDFTLQPLRDTWLSPITHATYPIHWKVSVPRLGVELELTTPLPAQELTSDDRITPNYWEGAITIQGHQSTARLNGVGYLEMTGYDRPFAIQP